MNVSEIEEYTGADSLKYLQIKDLEKTVENPQEYCYACFDGKYPIQKDAE